MNLLFDQNISFRIIEKVNNHFKNVQQVRKVGLENADDNTMWQFAKENDFAIVSFDADFNDLANLRGVPPKIIWLRTGNMTTNNIAQLLIMHKDIIISFLSEKSYDKIACLEIE